MTGMGMDDTARAALFVDRLEAGHGHGDHLQSLEAAAWYGGDLDRAWFEVEGDRVDGALGDTRLEAAWRHALSTYWDARLGVRHDIGPGPRRTWAAFGLAGLAPYWFDIDAALYAGDGGRTALRVEARYDVALTQRAIVQMRVEANAYGRDDRRRAIGAGLADVETGLRLRYEVTRQFAPYAGVEFAQRTGNTARLGRAVGEDASDLRLVAGLRFWF